MSTILIADDEARIRRLVSDFLKRDGHTILEAADGRAAMQLIENRRPSLDLAILDDADRPCRGCGSGTRP